MCSRRSVKNHKNTSYKATKQIECWWFTRQMLWVTVKKTVPKWSDARIERARTETFWILNHTYFYWLKNSKHETKPQSKHQFIPLSLPVRERQTERYSTKFKMLPFVGALFVRHATSEQTWIYLVLNRKVTELSPRLVDILLKLSFLPLLRRFRCTLFVRLHFPFIFTENPRPCLLITSFFLL